MDRYSHVILVIRALQLSFFLGASSDGCVIIDIIANVVYPIYETPEKTSCLKIGR